MHHHFSSLIFQCDTSALGGSPSSTFTCSTASPCSESPSSTLSSNAGVQPLAQPLSLPSPQCSSSTSTTTSGPLCSPVKSPAPPAATGPLTRSSPGPPTHSPTSTLESKDSGIIGEGCCCCCFTLIKCSSSLLYCVFNSAYIHIYYILSILAFGEAHFKRTYTVVVNCVT